MEDSILEAIYRSTLKLLVPNSVDEIYQTIVTEAIKLVEAESGVIYLEEAKSFKPVYSTNPIMYDIVPRKNGNTIKAFKTHSTIIADLSDVGKAHPSLNGLHMKSSIFIPLSYQNKALGVLTLNTAKEEFFTPKKKQILELFGSMASLAIKKSHFFDEMSTALETRDLFISMAGHELRTPLTAINGYAQLLKSKISDLSTPEGRWVEQLSWECVRLTVLVKELLTINQIKSGNIPYDWQECQISKILERVQSDCVFVYPNREIVFKNELHSRDDKVIGDFDKLLQVFTNVIENAVKFSDASSKVIVTVRLRTPFISIGIRDFGIGIDDADLPKIFDKYFKGMKHTREGMGIGLYIAKDIVDRHRGLIKVRTKVDKGTKVEVKLPKAKL